MELNKDSQVYTPKPIDTSHVELSLDLENMAELLAMNAHELWARDRAAAGWTYGPARNDEAKSTSTMIPYADLPESEKQYDRNNAMETLRTIVSLGYRITRERGFRT